MSSPISTIHIISGIPLDNRYEHTLYFQDRTAQYNYFLGKVVKTFTGYTYLRKNWSIKVEASMADAHKWSYLFFRNPGHELKWYYYFINTVRYVNESTVELDLELDVLQTYQHDWTMKQCFVERETVRNDAVGKHIVPEDLDIGTIVTPYAVDLGAFKNMCILMLSTQDEGGIYSGCNVYDGVFSGLSVYAIDYSKKLELSVFLKALNAAGKIDTIVAMWMYPKSLIRVENWDNLLNPVLGTGYDDSDESGLKNVPCFEGYTPRNNKLRCYPYRFLYATNNCGEYATYHFERFLNGKLSFGFAGAIAPDAGAKFYPHQYNCFEAGGAAGYEAGLSVPSFPACAWESDTYKVWLAQNQNQLRVGDRMAKNNAAFSAVNAVTGLVGGVVGGYMAGGVGGGIAGGLSAGINGVANALNACENINMRMAIRDDMAIQPDQARGSFSSSVNVANGKHTITLMVKCITKEYAERLDDYFTRYGYKVNTIKTPSINNRLRFTYVKTIGCTITGEIGTEDRMKIEAIFDKGVTWWADTFNPCDYTADNDPLGGDSNG